LKLGDDKERKMDSIRRKLHLAHNDDSNALIYMLAGVGLGAIIGAAAGLLFAPKAGTELRHDIGDKFGELKGKTEEWVAEQKAKRAVNNAAEELGV
jgi:gas vesicle protein